MNAIISIIILLILLALGLTVYSIFHGDTQRENLCKESCTEYNAEFVDYEPGYYRNEECWCKRKGEPLRIW